MHDIDKIIKICSDLAQQGKTPTVALIRNHASQPLPIPVVIKGLQRWKTQPDVRKSNNTPVESQNLTTKPNNHSLTQRVAELEKQVKELKQIITHLTQSVNNQP
ncbi:hypothetical protein [Paraglaciecola aestuariivivens]